MWWLVQRSHHLPWTLCFTEQNTSVLYTVEAKGGEGILLYSVGGCGGCYGDDYSCSDGLFVVDRNRAGGVAFLHTELLTLGEDRFTQEPSVTSARVLYCSVLRCVEKGLELKLTANLFWLPINQFEYFLKEKKAKFSDVRFLNVKNW